jgi:hypothetical protein
MELSGGARQKTRTCSCRRRMIRMRVQLEEDAVKFSGCAIVRCEVLWGKCSGRVRVTPLNGRGTTMLQPQDTRDQCLILKLVLLSEPCSKGLPC